MNRTGSLFSQILSLFQRSNFSRHVRELQAEYHARGFSCWDQFVAMLFCQLAQARSLREISDGLTDGKTGDVKVAQSLDFPKGSIVALDRGYTDYKLYARWTKEGVFFVTRLKANADVLRVKSLPTPKGSNVLRDEIICLNPFMAGRPDLPDLRRVVVWLEDKKEELVLLTNNFTLAASTIAAIYKERWQIELFFKLLKQQLKIKTFVGTSANAVRIQIWTALMAVLVVRYLQFRSNFQWAVSNLVALLRWNLFSYRDLWEWINRPFDTPPEALSQLQLNLDSSRIVG